MTIDRATLSFLETLNQHAAMQEELENALARAEDPLQTVIAFASDKGFEVTAQGLNAAKSALAAASGLSDGELDAVAGGFNPQPEPPERTSPGDVESFLHRFNRRLIRW